MATAEVVGFEGEGEVGEEESRTAADSWAERRRSAAAFWRGVIRDGEEAATWWAQQEGENRERKRANGATQSERKQDVPSSPLVRHVGQLVTLVLQESRSLQVLVQAMPFPRQAVVSLVPRRQALVSLVPRRQVLVSLAPVAQLHVLQRPSSGLQQGQAQVQAQTSATMPTSWHSRFFAQQRVLEQSCAYQEQQMLAQAQQALALVLALRKTKKKKNNIRCAVTDREIEVRVSIKTHQHQLPFPRHEACQ